MAPDHKKGNVISSWPSSRYVCVSSWSRCCRVCRPGSTQSDCCEFPAGWDRCDTYWATGRQQRSSIRNKKQLNANKLVFKKRRWEEARGVFGESAAFLLPPVLAHSAQLSPDCSRTVQPTGDRNMLSRVISFSIDLLENFLRNKVLNQMGFKSSTCVFWLILRCKMFFFGIIFL